MNPNCNPQDHNNKVALIIKELEQKGMTQHIEKETRRFSENYNRYCEQQQQHQLHHQQQPNNHTIIPTTTTTTIRPIYKGPYPYKTDYQYIQAIYSGEAKTNPLTGELEIIKKKPFSFDINEKKNIIIALGFGILYNIFFIFWGFKMINFYYKRGESAKDYYNYGWSYIILNIIFSIIMILIIVNFYMKNPFLNDETIVFLQIFIIINALINIFVPASHWHFILNI
jgi:hypothetical protein